MFYPKQQPMPHIQNNNRRFAQPDISGKSHDANKRENRAYYRREQWHIRATIISLGVVTSELGNDITDPDTATAMPDFRQLAIGVDAITRIIRFAID